MIKQEEDHLHDDENEANGKRRRVQRACDVCRKKKIRCDGLQPEKGACSNCASYGLDCTFADAVKRRAPPRSYVIALEARMEKAEEVIAQLTPYLDINKILGPMPLLPSDKKEGEDTADSPPHTTSATLTFADHSRNTSKASRSPNDESWEGAEDDEDAAYLRTSMNKASLSEENVGRSSIASGDGQRGTPKMGTMTLTEALGFDSNSKNAPERSSFASSDAPAQFIGRASNFHLLPLLERMSMNNISTPLMPHSEVDIPGPYESPFQTEEPDYSKMDFKWPAPDLQSKLIDAYFSRPNQDLPLLNEVITRRTFSNPSWQNEGFSTITIALGMFSVASRYLDDERLLSPLPDRVPVSLHWFKELQPLLVNHFSQYGSTVPYLQATLLNTIYMSAIPKTTIARAWVSLSLVVRMLEDSGAHRKFTAKRLGYSLLTEETYKRIWWVTYVLDRQLSSELGRPMAIQDEDFDLDEILLVNDYHLVQASEAGRDPIQPPGELCVYEGFLQSTRLSQVVGRTLRTIYAISKSKISRGFVGRKWDALVVAEIDKSLNKWLENVPDHLRYNPGEVNPVILMQSSKIHVQYYYTQTLIHRPYIQNEKAENSELTFKSLAIVSNAARSAIHIIYNLLQRGLVANTSSEALNRTFAFGCMLLFISWSALVKNVHVSNSIMSDVYKCLDILQAMRNRWSKATEMSKVLEIIIQRSQIPTSIRSNSSRQSTGKRGFEEETSFTSIPATSMSKSAPKDTRQKLASSQLPLSTLELQSSFTGGSPDSVGNLDSSSGSSSLRSQPSPNDRAHNEPPSLNGTTINQLSDSHGRINNNLIRAEQWIPPPLQQQSRINAQIPIPTSAPQYMTDNTTSIDSTIFDPSNRTLDALFNNNNARPTMNNTQYSFGTPSGGTQQPFDNLEAFQVSELLNQTTDNDGLPIGRENNNMADPLDALVNTQSLWSDVDWMRALEFQL